LIQLPCGGPQIVYHGGLLHLRLRYFDTLERRPGLPQDVSAQVSHQDADSTTVQLVNHSPLHERRLILQAGAFGEHNFTEVRVSDEEGGQPVSVNGKHFEVVLPPARTLSLKLGMNRYANTPGYEQPI
jgi:hypothetical protein